MELTQEQFQAVNEIDHNLQIIACAGSGKTEVITRRIVNILTSKNEVAPENIVAFTFTNKAADSMKKRIDKAVKEAGYAQNLDSMYVGTIHSFCWHLLKKYCPEYEEFSLLDSVKEHLFVERYAEKSGMELLDLKKGPVNTKLFLECINKLVDDFDNSKKWNEKNFVVFNEYKSLLSEHKYLDFSFLVHETIEQLKTNTDVQKYISGIKYLIVDEYQDIDDLQEQIIKEFANFGTNICVVGDDDQTIYQFRGSNADNMISFSKRYDDVVCVTLDKNFRCASDIVELADCVIKNNKNRLEKTMVSGCVNSASHVIARKQDNGNEEYRYIAKEIERLHNTGLDYKEIAILVRKGKHIDTICKSLDDLDIPYDTDSSERFFNGLYFGKFLETFELLQDFSKPRYVSCWKETLGEEELKKGFRFLREVYGSNGTATKNPLSKIMTDFSDLIGFTSSKYEDCDIRKADVESIVLILNDFDEIYGDCQLSFRLKVVVDFLNRRAIEEYKYHNFYEKSESDDAVQIMTIHKAKGLEFDTVFLPHMEHNEFPVRKQGGKKYYTVLGGEFERNKSKYEADIDDERKLFYVAVTRAKRNLYFIYELEKHNISQFLIEANTASKLSINAEDLIIKEVHKKAHYDSEWEQKQQDYQKQWADERTEKQEQWEEERQAMQLYWAKVNEARHRLYDYYGSATHFCKGAYGDLAAIKHMEPDDILRVAIRNGLI